MIDIIYTRLLLWKKKAFSMIFWLLLPTIGTYLFITVSGTLEEDIQIPIGVVIQEDSELASELLNTLMDSDLVHVMELSEEEALYKLEKHDLDSVFIVHQGFQENILKGRRNNLISSYRTELSFAYSPVKEMIVSHVQEKTGRAKAALFIQTMQEQYGEAVRFDDIIERSKQIQIDENLLNTTFAYANASSIMENPNLLSWNTWGIWAIFSFLSTLFLSDWIIREKSLAVSTRYSFMKLSLSGYYIRIILLYLLVFIIFDLLSMIVFTSLLHEEISLLLFLKIINFRFMLCLLAFQIAMFFQKRSKFYGSSIILTLIFAIMGGVVIPVHGITSQHTMFEYINPLHAFLHGEFTIFWTIISIAAVMLTLMRKEISNA